MKLAVIVCISVIIYSSKYLYCRARNTQLKKIQYFDIYIVRINNLRQEIVIFYKNLKCLNNILIKAESFHITQIFLVSEKGI